MSTVLNGCLDHIKVKLKYCDFMDILTRKMCVTPFLKKKFVICTIIRKSLITDTYHYYLVSCHWIFAKRGVYFMYDKLSDETKLWVFDRVFFLLKDTLL